MLSKHIFEINYLCKRIFAPKYVNMEFMNKDTWDSIGEFISVILVNLILLSAQYDFKRIKRK